MATTSAEGLNQAVSAYLQAARLLDVPRMHVWDERGLTLPQLRILFHIRQHPGSGVRDLAQAFDVSASNITQQVDRLVTRGLVHRVDRPDDRRHVSLTLTEEGERVAGEVSQTSRGFLAEVLSQLPADERDRLTALLLRVVESAGRIAASGAPR